MVYLENVGPIVTTMDIRDDFTTYTSGIYRFVSGDFIRGGHTVLIIGFGTDPGPDGGDYWLSPRIPSALRGG